MPGAEERRKDVVEAELLGLRRTDTAQQVGGGTDAAVLGLSVRSPIRAEERDADRQPRARGRGEGVTQRNLVIVQEQCAGHLGICVAWRHGKQWSGQYRGERVLHRRSWNGELDTLWSDQTVAARLADGNIEHDR